MTEEQQVAAEFALVNRKDPEALRRIFLKYNCMTMADWMRVLGISTRSLRKFRRRAGFIDPSAPKSVPRPDPSTRPVDEIDTFADTPEWWRKHYPKYGRVKLQRASGLSYDSTRRRIKRHCGWISHEEATKSKHPCASEKWLKVHYTEKGYSMIQCAAVAGVSEDTIKVWLLRYNIEIRHTSHGPVVGKNSRQQLECP